MVHIGEDENIKSIGNSLTNYKDIDSEEDVRMLIYLLSDAVSARLRESQLERVNTVHIYARASDLTTYHKQGRLSFPSGNVKDIAEKAFEMFKEIYPWERYVRGIGVSVSDFDLGGKQMNMFETVEQDEKQQRLNETIDNLRARYGNNVLQLAIVTKDARIKQMDVKGEHTIHPYSFFKNGK